MADSDAPDLDLPPIDEIPAAHLAGKELPNGWKVRNRIERTPGATGGHFSIPYEVEREDGRVAFMKALNIQPALQGPGRLVDRLNAFTQAAKFEADLLLECRKKGLTRVIQLLDEGQIAIPEAGVLQDVPYLIFEPAEGDIRAFQAQTDSFDVAWALRTLKHVSQAVEQLHLNQTTHQDLKPSNVLTQDEGTEMKVGDLGRAERKGIDGPTSSFSIPGAVAYAPPEQLYGAFSHTWEERRAGDVYLLGSLAAQLFVKHNFTTVLLDQLAPVHRHENWSQPFDQVLPYLARAHADAIAQVEREVTEKCDEDEICGGLIEAIAQLTFPDPSERGHPKARRRRGSNYNVRYYVSLFNRLAALAEFRLRRNLM